MKINNNEKRKVIDNILNVLRYFRKINFKIRSIIFKGFYFLYFCLFFKKVGNKDINGII